LKDDFFYVLLN